MSDYLKNPHDRFFKDIFTRQEAARDFLRHYLPADIVSLLDLSTLDISKDSFVDPELQEHLSDLLYKVRLQTGSESYVYVLFEHKSYVEPLIALQLLRYMVRIWDQSLKQKEPLLPIVPLVIYHGRQPWTAALDFAALFETPDALKPFVPSYQYWLCDLSRYSDEAIKATIEGGVILQIGLLLLKYSGQDDFGRRLSDILQLLKRLSEQDTALEYLETILRYVAGSAERLTAAELTQVVRDLLEEGEKLMPTIAEQWVEQGRREGRLEGREEGRLEGREEGREEGKEEGREEGRETALMILRRFLAQRFDTALDRFDADFAALDLAAVTRLSEVAFEVKSLTEFEAALARLKTDQGRTRTKN